MNKWQADGSLFLHEAFCQYQAATRLEELHHVSYATSLASPGNAARMGGALDSVA